MSNQGVGGAFFLTGPSWGRVLWVCYLPGQGVLMEGAGWPGVKDRAGPLPTGETSSLVPRTWSVIGGRQSNLCG